MSWDPLNLHPGQPDGAPADEYDSYADAVTAILATSPTSSNVGIEMVAYYLSHSIKYQMERVTSAHDQRAVAMYCWEAYQSSACR